MNGTTRRTAEVELAGVTVRREPSPSLAHRQAPETYSTSGEPCRRHRGRRRHRHLVGRDGGQRRHAAGPTPGVHRRGPRSTPLLGHRRACPRGQSRTPGDARPVPGAELSCRRPSSPLARESARSRPELLETRQFVVAAGLSNKVVILEITVDPRRDSLERMEAFARLPRDQPAAADRFAPRPGHVLARLRDLQPEGARGVSTTGIDWQTHRPFT